MDDYADLQLHLTAALGARLKRATPTGSLLAPRASLFGLTDLAVRRTAERAVEPAASTYLQVLTDQQQPSTTTKEN